MMKVLSILVLLSSTQLCSTAPGLEPVTCSEASGATAARLAMHHIDRHHDHGYKFRLNGIQGNTVEMVDEGCNMELQLDLRETTCHTVNPMHFEDCTSRTLGAQEVMANCTVLITVKDSDAKVTKYECNTRQVLTPMEMVRACPDCPRLISLNDPEGLNSVNEAVKKFNENTTNQHYYILQEVGRMRTGYIPGVGMNYYAEFALVETHCPRESRIIPQACKPLCPDRAHHVLCSSSYSVGNGLGRVSCEFYPPKNTTVSGEQDPVCPGRPPHAVGPPHPPGSPSRGNAGGPPPGKGPLQEKVKPVHPVHPVHPCHTFLSNADPALHPICPWPLPQPRQS